MHLEKMKDKKKKKKKHKKKNEDSSDEDEAKKKEKLKKVIGLSVCAQCQEHFKKRIPKK